MRDDENTLYRLTAIHPKRNEMDELVFGITEAKELKKEWEEDGWEVTLEEEYK